ncbi:MAG TPA: hypothetical protein VFU16_12775 [Solirubrobacterales bacterium]|nr:hypothetical protein [Solirubrobacterales bacterium]
MPYRLTGRCGSFVAQAGRRTRTRERRRQVAGGSTLGAATVDVAAVF